MKGKLMILLITAIFFIPFLIEIINLKMLDILKNIIECLKVKKNGIFKFSLFKISYYIILPVVVPILIMLFSKPVIENDFLGSITTILVLIVGFLLNLIFIINSLIEKNTENIRKKEALIILYDLIIYCILISFVLLMISIILFFTKNEVLVYILFSFGIHFFSVFVYLFHTSVQILKMSVK